MAPASLLLLQRSHMMFFFSKNYKVGDQVIYRKSKKSDSPSPNAINLWAESSGESYRYTIKKYWTVIQLDGERLQVITRRGKRHWLNRNDPLLRKATWCERWFREEKFPLVDSDAMEREALKEEHTSKDEEKGSPVESRDKTEDLGA